MNRRTFLGVAGGAAVTSLAGCSSADAGNDDSVSSNLLDIVAQEDGMIVVVVADNPQVTEQVCSYNPALGFPTCNTNYQEVTIEEINGETASAGDTIRFETPNSEEYTFDIVTSNGVEQATLFFEGEVGELELATVDVSS